MVKMHKKLFGVLYAINIISQAVFTLLIPTALGFGISWLLVTRAGAPEWLYAIFIPIGVIIGLVSMVKFAISAAEALERLEKQRKNNEKTGNTTDEK